MHDHAQFATKKFTIAVKTFVSSYQADSLCKFEPKGGAHITAFLIKLRVATVT